MSSRDCLHCFDKVLLYILVHSGVHLEQQISHVDSTFKLHITALQSVYCFTMVISCLGSLAASGLLMALSALEVASTSVSWMMFVIPSCSASCFKLFQNCFTPRFLLEWKFLPCNTHNCLDHFQSVLVTSKDVLCRANPINLCLSNEKRVFDICSDKNEHSIVWCES